MALVSLECLFQLLAVDGLGAVGDVVGVDPQPVLDQLAAGRIPVVSSIAPDHDNPGHSLNVNADAAASALATALGASKLVVLTDVAGLYADWPASSEVIARITSTELKALLPSLPEGKTTDYIMPLIVQSYAPAFVGALTLIALLAAAVSTANSMLLNCGTSLYYDLYRSLYPERQFDDQSATRHLRFVVLGLGLLSVISAIKPPVLLAMGFTYVYGAFGAAFQSPRRASSSGTISARPPTRMRSPRRVIATL